MALALCYLHCLLQQGSFFFFFSSYPISPPPPFSFRRMCMALPMPHPPFPLHAGSLYPWQPMISFSPELGARPRARRRVLVCECDFDIGCEGRGGAGGVREGGIGFKHILPHFSFLFYAKTSATISQPLCQLKENTVHCSVKKCHSSPMCALACTSRHSGIYVPHTVQSCLPAATNRRRCAPLAVTFRVHVCKQ